MIRRWVQIYDTKLVITRFGLVQMPRSVNPACVTAEQLLTNPDLKLIPDADTTEGVRRILATQAIEPLPELHPKPVLTSTQLCLLEIVAELHDHDCCDLETAIYHYGIINGLSEAMATMACMKVWGALVRMNLVTMEGGQLTPLGHARIRAEEEAEDWRGRLGLRKYRLERIERNPDPQFDEVFFIRERHLACYFRRNCFEIRPRAKFVILSSLPSKLF